MKSKKYLILVLALLTFPHIVFSAEKEVASKGVTGEQISEIILSGKSEADICSFLKENKIAKSELNKTDKNGYSSLYLAIDRKKPEVVKTLLQKGADKNQISNLKVRDSSGRRILRCSPVLYAAWKGDVKSLEILMKSGSKTNVESDFIIPTENGVTYIRLMTPIDAAFYNRRQISFNDVHKQLATKPIVYTHIHFSGQKWAYNKIKTKELLKEYNLLEIKK